MEVEFMSAFHWQSGFAAHHFLAELPERREPVDEGGGDSEGAEQQVRDRQVDDEYVPRGPHGLGDQGQACTECRPLAAADSALQWE